MSPTSGPSGTQRTMTVGEGILRCAAGLFAFITFTGTAWFLDDSATLLQLMLSFAPTIALAMGAILPRRILGLSVVRIFFTLILIAGLAYEAKEAIGDFDISGGVDYFAMTLRTLIVTTMVLLLVSAYRRP